MCSRALASLSLLLVVLAAAGARAEVFYTQKEALTLAFPDADRLEKHTYVLSDAQHTEIEKLARSPLETRLVQIHTAWRGSELLGYAHIDVHTVRTKSEGLIVVLDAAGRVRSVRVLAFYEPLEYLPTERWYERFAGRGPSDPLSLGRDVDAVSGATLTARATTEGVRRMLAYHAALLAH
ncbi:MAG TPA: FMN-binding protein [Planctomycetota bacterium]|nr:FMN-binding protein [Planctomycetota bacterium]